MREAPRRRTTAAAGEPASPSDHAEAPGETPDGLRREEGPTVEREPRIRRVLGCLRGAEAGPTLLCIAGLHGNEPAGVRAVHRVVRRLEEGSADLRGEFVSLAGNLGALTLGRRFLDRDLNRLWTPERTELLRRNELERPGTREDAEQQELLAAIEEVLDRARGPVHVLDLHTTSGEGPPFVTVGDTLANRRFARRLGAPLVLGLEETLEGTLTSYLDELGLVTAGFEAGSHEAPGSIDAAEAAVWLALRASGVLVRGGEEVMDAPRRHLRAATEDLPRVTEVRYRHPVDPGDGFRMRPGFASFEAIEDGVALAEAAGETVRAPEAGLLLMPLYQELGEDGFFVIRKVRPLWLRLSALLRKLGCDARAHWLPGVRRDPDDRRVLRVDRGTARLGALPLFHLLGFRKRREEEGELVMVRRVPKREL